MCNSNGYRVACLSVKAAVLRSCIAITSKPWRQKRWTVFFALYRFVWILQGLELLAAVRNVYWYSSLVIHIVQQGHMHSHSWKCQVLQWDISSPPIKLSQTLSNIEIEETPSPSPFTTLIQATEFPSPQPQEINIIIKDHLQASIEERKNNAHFSSRLLITFESVNQCVCVCCNFQGKIPCRWHSPVYPLDTKDVELLLVPLPHLGWSNGRRHHCRIAYLTNIRWIFEVNTSATSRKVYSPEN